nr:cupin domain-containing protein [Acrocarpospora macrocephala]
MAADREGAGRMPQWKRLSPEVDDLAPDGSSVRLLCATERGSMAHFELPPGAVSRAVRHRTVEEIWYVVAGIGAMWQNLDDENYEILLEQGLSLTIPVGVAFQFRNSGTTVLEIVAITMPPWPGPAEAQPAEGRWPSTM